MVYEEVVVGSGLSALGTLLGLNRGRVLVLAGGQPARSWHYPDHRSVPFAHDGPGGLGNFWHGVIPTGLRSNFGGCSFDDFRRMFGYFYPRVKVDDRLGQQFLFVPKRPIRPLAIMQRLAAESGRRIEIDFTRAAAFTRAPTSISCTTSDGRAVSAGRMWLAAGSVHTPELVEKSLDCKVFRGLMSDHITCYLGQVHDVPPPQISRRSDGVFFPYWIGRSGRVLYTLRPARFDFRQLDRGIERRAAFGLPTSRALISIGRNISPGLVSEALFTRFGYFPRSDVYSVYAQVAAPDAYEVQMEPLTLRPLRANIAAAVRLAHDDCPIDGLVPTRRLDLYIPGIHLHHSVDAGKVTSAGLDGVSSRVRMVDASAVTDIGPEHHSFKLLEWAQRRGASAAPLT